MTKKVLAPDPESMKVDMEHLRMLVGFIARQFELGKRRVVFTDFNRPGFLKEMDIDKYSRIPDDLKEAAAASFRAAGWVDVHWGRTSGKLTNPYFTARNPNPPTAQVD